MTKETNKNGVKGGKKTRSMISLQKANKNIQKFNFSSKNGTKIKKIGKSYHLRQEKKQWIMTKSVVRVEST
jgi:hypothetical protein